MRTIGRSGRQDGRRNYMPFQSMRELPDREESGDEDDGRIFAKLALDDAPLAPRRTLLLSPLSHRFWPNFRARRGYR